MRREQHRRPVAPPPSVASHDHRGRRHHPFLTFAAIVVPVAVVAFVAVQLFVVRSANPDTPKHSTAAIAVKGTLEIFDTAGSGFTGNGAGECTGSGGFSAIKAGAPVVITDQQGTTLATASLSDGAGSPGTSFTPCIFTFTASVSGGTGLDTIAIAQIARSTFSQTEMATPSITLGNTQG
jgi:hypothetical protein